MVEKVQRKAARFVSGDHKWDSSVSAMISSLGWKSLQERRCVARLTMLHKACHDQTAVHIPDYMHNPNRTLRGHHQFCFRNIRANTDTYLYSFFPRTVKCWNLLPATLVQKESSGTFQNHLWKAIDNGEMIVMSPRDQQSRPRLGGNIPQQEQQLVLN